MKTKQLVVVGASGHGRETLDIVEAINAARPGTYQLLGVLDAAPSSENLQLLASRSIPYLGTEDAWLKTAPAEVRYVIGIAAPAIKAVIDRKFTRAGLEPETLIHPKTWIGSMSALGLGTVVWPNASITTNVATGRHVSLNNNCTIGHDTVIGDYTSVHPGATISGDVTLETEVVVGSNAVVLQGRTVGQGTTVGAAACVTTDLPADTIAKGVPARVQ